MTITIGNSQGIPMGKYTPSTGGGGGGGGTVSVAEKYGVQGDYATHYGILDCPNGLITYSLGKDIIIEPGIVLQAAGSDTKTTIASAINYTIVEDTDVTLFYAEGTILEAGAVYYQTEEPTDGDVGYLAWFNPEIMQWQFKSDDTGNVWRTAVATPIANVRIVDGNITRLDYMGYRILDDDIIAHKQDVDELEALLDEKQDVLTPTSPITIGTTTIGGPVNIVTSNGYIQPVFHQGVNGQTSGSDYFFVLNDAVTNPISFSDLFTTNASYFDVPVDFATAVDKVANNMIPSYNLQLLLEVATQKTGVKVMVFGCNSSESGITPVTANLLILSKDSATHQGAYFLTGEVEGVSSGLKLFCDGTYSTTQNSGSTSSEGTIAFTYSISGSTIGATATHYYGGTYRQVTVSKTNTETSRAQISQINMLRVVIYYNFTATGDITNYPTVDGTVLKEYEGSGWVETDWNINSGAVTTYGIRLKMDNQTITTNANGELTVNMDELGNEVNAISGRVTTLETNMGGLKLQKITEADYEALTLAGTVDENTMYLIVDDTTA